MSTTDPRATMAPLFRRFGPHIHGAVQRALTWLTGKPLAGHEPLFLWTPTTRALAAFATLALGLCLSGLALGGGVLLFLLPWGWLLTAGALRAFYLELAHAAVHGVFTRDDSRDPFWTEFFTTLSLTNHHGRFEVEHIKFHHRFTGGFGDVDYHTLLSWGFRPGMSKAALWGRLRRVILSPRVHSSYLVQRLGTNFGPNVPRLRRLAAAGMLVAPLAAAWATGAWTFYFLAWVFPLTYGYQLSSLLQMVGAEHLWGVDHGTGKARIAHQTYGRFLGDAYPESGIQARSIWWLRLIGLHLPARLAVYIGHDLGPAHDMHHREPKADWANAPYVRQSKQDAGSPGWPVPYFDHWGSLASHVDRVFDGLASLPPMDAAQDELFDQAERKIRQARNDD